jgi:hypothetical protein
MSSLGFDRLVMDCQPSKVASYEEAGLAAKVPSSPTGLTPEAAYQFKVNTVNYTVTMPTGTITYAVLVKTINANATILAAKIRVILIAGDLRFYIEAATITLAAGTAADLFTALTAPLGDTKVNAIMMVEYQITGKRACINAIAINFPISYTGVVIWELDKYTGIEYDQRFSSSAIAASTSYYIETLVTPCGSGDKVIIYTEAACAGTSYVTLSWSHNGF